MTASQDRLSPAELAVRHVSEVARAIAAPAAAVNAEAIGRARPAWPVWPQVALERLVGPPARRLAHLDLRWLHRFEALVAVVDQLSAAVGGPHGGPSGLSLLVERSQMLGHHGWGTWSAGTSCRLFRAHDRWVAINLPRDDDLASVPAIFECGPGDDAWGLVAEHVPHWDAADVVERAALLAVPAAMVPEAWVVDHQRSCRGLVEPDTPCLVTQGIAVGRGVQPRVVDLTSLWAGPLAGWYLARAGAEVIKVESVSRPDGARAGTPAFWRRLNSNKQLVELELRSEDGRRQLRRLVAGADIVLEASRPRALTEMGLSVDDHVTSGGIWCSLTGYGRTGPLANRVAFGDDAAVAGGLVTVVDDEPWFIGDAAADPVAGVTAAAGVLSLWANGVAGVVDLAMRDAVAHLTGGRPVPSRSS